MKLVRALIATVLCFCLIAPFGLQVKTLAENITPPASVNGGGDGISAPADPRPEPIDDDLPVIDLTENDDHPIIEPITHDPIDVRPTESPFDEIDPNSIDYEYYVIYNTLLYTTTYTEYKRIIESIPDTKLEAFLVWLDQQSEDVKCELRIHIEELDREYSEYYDNPIHSFLNVAPCINNNYTTPNIAIPSRSVDDDFIQSGGIGVSKNVYGPDANDYYTISLEAFTTGTVTTTVEKIPADIVLVLDVSGSMEEAFASSTTYKYTELPQSYVNYHSSWFTLQSDCYYYYRSNLFVKLSNGEYRKVTVSNPLLSSTTTYSWLGLDGTTVSIQSRGDGSRPLPANDSAGNRIEHFYYREIESQTGTTRIAALKSAVKTFIDTVRDKSQQDGVTHRIAIVKFAGNDTNVIGNDTYTNYYTYNYSQTVIGLTEVTNAGATQLKSLVDALNPGGATHADYGMQHAEDILAGIPVSEQNHTKVVIMFTDGEPTSQSNFEETVANGAISVSNDIKTEYNATVYTVGIFAGADASMAYPLPDNDDENRTNRYMHLVSSNYIGATSMTQIGTYTNPSNGMSYYLSPENADQLNDVFQSIANASATAGAVLNSETVIHDIVAPSFMLPVGTDESSIEITILDAVNPVVSGTEPYQLISVDDWLDLDDPDHYNNSNAHLSELAHIQIDIPEEGAEDQRPKVNVTGFDFSQWCLSTNPRPETYKDAQGNQHTVTTNGKKIVITFRVQINPDFLGGNGVDTNGPESGIYVPGKTTPEIEFPQPEINVPIGNVYVEAFDKSVHLLGEVSEEDLLEGLVVKIERYGSDGDQTNESNFVRCRVVRDPVTGTYGVEPLVPGVNPEMCAYLEFVPNFTFYLAGGGQADVDVVEEDDGTYYYFKHDCKLYDIDVTLRPTKPYDPSIPGGAATEVVVNDIPTKNVYVYLPVLMFKDTYHWYYEAIDVSAAALTANNYLPDEIVWEHPGMTYDEDDMVGEKPAFGFEYSIPEGCISTGTPSIVITVEDIPVNVTPYVVDLPENDHNNVQVFPNGEYLLDETQYEFAHQACDPACDFNAATEEFLLHIESCEIWVTKAFTSGNTPTDSDETFLFDIAFTGTNSTAANGTYRLAIEGAGTKKLVKLPRGSYTVSEVNDWAWRYPGNLAQQSGTLTLANPTGTHTFTNTDRNNMWLGDEANANNNFSVLNVTSPDIMPDAIIPGKGGIVYEEQ